MMRKIVALVLLGILGLSAELWINVIQDPGAELGAGDWESDVWESPEGSGASDSVRVDPHDTSRAYEGSYSFLTDTEKDPESNGGGGDAFCYQILNVPKAINDLDSCQWAVYMFDAPFSFMARFYICFRTQSGKTLLWCSGNGSSEGQNDTLYSILFPAPDNEEWQLWGSNFYRNWVDLAGWSEYDTIKEIQLRSRGENDPYWAGQEVSWDNIVLEGIAYYDYAAESINSDETADEHYTPVATFANEGIKDDQPGKVYAEILDGETCVYIDSQEVDIPHESSEQVTFAEWTVPHDGSYTLRVYPILELDEYSADDTLEQALTGLAVKEAHSDLSPALEIKGSTIHYSLPPDQKGTLKVFDALGQLVERVEVNASGSVEFNSALASGVYFARVECGSSAYTGKVVLVR
jgi:hypothetical protein